MINWDLCKTTPREHQKVGVEALLQHPLFMLADEVGAGKSKQVVDAAQILATEGRIDTVVVLTPAFARGVWADPRPALGEVAKHGWDSVVNRVREYSVANKNLKFEPTKGELLWMVSNYEFVRREERLLPLLAFLQNRRFWLVCDEAWAIKDHRAEQWKASAAIRRMAARVTLLNGTPIADDPLDLFAQMKILDPRILQFKFFSHFRARYAILKANVNFPLITGWQNLEELRDRVKPYVLRRRTRDCFDLPPVLDPIMIEARLSDSSWRTYRQMRDDMVAWLSLEDASVAKQAIVKGLRLAQITSGFLGGILKLDPEEAGMLNFTDRDDLSALDLGAPEGPPEPPREIGREKLDAMLVWLRELRPQPDRVLIWSRFRPEIERTAAAFDPMSKSDWLARRAHMLYGGQSKAARQEAVDALNPELNPGEPVVVVGTPSAGGAGLNLAGASIAISMSTDFNLRTFLQSRGRIDRPGQRNPIRYVDIVATGPKGQRTIDHHVLEALRSKEDIANWTAATWIKKLIAE